jgi:hypothetical protein
LPVSQGALGQLQLLVSQALGEVGLGYCADQGDLRCLAALLTGQVTRERRIGECAHAAEQVQLKGAEGDVHPGLLVHLAASLAVRIGRQSALTRARSLQPHSRQTCGALDVRLGLRCLDVEDGQSQVAVIGQRKVDQPLQARVGEHRAPAQGAGRQHRGWFSSHGIARGHRCGRTLQRRGQ